MIDFIDFRCARLGVQSLAYLWQRNQEDLLDEMIKSGLTAILIKVASLGKSLKLYVQFMYFLFISTGFMSCGPEARKMFLSCEGPQILSKCAGPGAIFCGIFFRLKRSNLRKFLQMKKKVFV